MEIALNIPLEPGLSRRRLKSLKAVRLVVQGEAVSDVYMHVL